MTKKSFKDSPALQFISSTDAEEEQGTPDFEAPTEKAPEGYKRNPLYVEVKSRRTHIALQPSLYDRVKKAATKEGLSFNEYVSRILDKETR